MPRRSYSIHERALYSLLIVEDAELTQLLSALDRIAEDPISAAALARPGPSGRTIFACEAGRFSIYYSLSKGGRHLLVTDIRLLDSSGS